MAKTSTLLKDDDDEEEEEEKKKDEREEREEGVSTLGTIISSSVDSDDGKPTCYSVSANDPNNVIIRKQLRFPSTEAHHLQSCLQNDQSSQVAIDIDEYEESSLNLHAKRNTLTGLKATVST
ncbi:hypothetical protein M0802_004940 [Mischocyttarus mexicanus]|nr:hypothetical protein M0802_004940 [Mischocyttarus mexicanus]